MNGKINCGHSDITLDPKLIKIITEIEKELNIELTATSGVRCQRCNFEAKGKPNSAHLTGKAVDILVTNSSYRFYLVKKIFEKGITRLSDRYTNIVHIDLDFTKPQGVMW